MLNTYVHMSNMSIWLPSLLGRGFVPLAGDSTWRLLRHVCSCSQACCNCMRLSWLAYTRPCAAGQWQVWRVPAWFLDLTLSFTSCLCKFDWSLPVEPFRGVSMCTDGFHHICSRICAIVNAWHASVPPWHVRPASKAIRCIYVTSSIPSTQLRAILFYFSNCTARLGQLSFASSCQNAVPNSRPVISLVRWQHMPTVSDKDGSKMGSGDGGDRQQLELGCRWTRWCMDKFGCMDSIRFWKRAIETLRYPTTKIPWYFTRGYMRKLCFVVHNIVLMNA